jgi:hypothetical protein
MLLTTRLGSTCPLASWSAKSVVAIPEFLPLIWAEPTCEAVVSGGTKYYKADRSGWSLLLGFE